MTVYYGVGRALKRIEHSMGDGKGVSGLPLTKIGHTFAQCIAPWPNIERMTLEYSFIAIGKLLTHFIPV